jgi:hypothetical protein
VLGIAGDRVTIAWTEQSVEHAHAAEQARPNMKDPNAVMGLPSVGESRIVVRTGVLER